MKPIDLLGAWVVVAVWALNFSVMKTGVQYFPPLFMVAVRFAILALLLAPFLKPVGRSPKRLLLLGLTMGCGHFALLALSLRYVDASAAAIVIQLGAPFSAIVAFVAFKDRLSRLQIAGMAVALGGVYLLAGSPSVGDRWPWLLVTAAAALFWALGNAQTKALGNLSPFTQMAWIAVITAPCLGLASLLLESGQWQASLDAGWRGWTMVLYTVFGSSITAYGIWYRLLDHHPINVVIPWSLLVPVVAVGLTVPMLGETLGPMTILGGAATVFGVTLVQLPHFLRRRPRP